MVHVPKQNRLKWDCKSSELIFVGYCDNMKGYRFYVPVCKKLVISRVVIFIAKSTTEENVTQEPVSLPRVVPIPSSTEINLPNPQNLTEEEDEDKTDLDDK